jgi:hypothetical protein
MAACANWPFWRDYPIGIVGVRQLAFLAESPRRSVIAARNARTISAVAHYLNPRGYTWQTYLRTAWWLLALLIGVGVAARNARTISAVAHYLNPRGYTWQTYLRTAWWLLALLIGVGVWLIWWATSTEQVVFGFVISAAALLDFSWKQFGRYVREGWRSQ